MPPRFPVEVCESIIDSLPHNDLETLGSCRLVSRSWAPRARAKFFVHVEFGHSKHVCAWKTKVSDSQDSPAIHPRSLCIRGTKWVTEADICFIKSSFANVEHLEIWSDLPRFNITGLTDRLVPFHNLLPKVKSLCMGWTRLQPWEIFNLICSFPFLEDLHVEGLGQVDNGGGGSDLAVATLRMMAEGCNDSGKSEGTTDWDCGGTEERSDCCIDGKTDGFYMLRKFNML